MESDKTGKIVRLTLEDCNLIIINP